MLSFCSPFSNFLCLVWTPDHSSFIPFLFFCHSFHSYFCLCLRFPSFYFLLSTFHSLPCCRSRSPFPFLSYLPPPLRPLFSAYCGHLWAVSSELNLLQADQRRVNVSQDLRWNALLLPPSLDSSRLENHYYILLNDPSSKNRLISSRARNKTDSCQ